ncbi:LysR substrate-binding domain-containing protein [Massilia cavernae]|uniref:LysR family transcriptional regulator n=1 Tax=Massilia cavernae TaxID=2320864 RepID=A0A418Y6E4_9BURK|nr:LysR substrate-binding domain-containing protein [Massilia cavernae]RJG23447.1 LysR family transcriptional regulator [Massilia cavernae]
MSRKIPMLKALICFDAAARHQSYTDAARELALTQSAVSRQIATLEGYLGLKLFTRTGHGVALTEAGANYARQVAPRLDGLERDTLDTMSRQGGRQAISLAAVPTFATRWLMPRLPGLYDQYPEMTVHIDSRTRPFMFGDTEFDAALYAGTPEQLANWPGTSAIHLIDERIIPVASPKLLAGRRRWHARDLVDLPLLQQSTRPDAWRQWFDAMDVTNELALRGPRFELFSMLTTGAAHGLGVALLPAILIESELASGELRQVCDTAVHGSRAYYLVTPERVDAKPALALFSGWLMRQAGR